LDRGFGEAYALIDRIAFLEPEPNAEYLEVFSQRVGPDIWGTRARYDWGVLLGRLGRWDEAMKDMNQLLFGPEATRQTQ
jgi:hypothetical protein